MGSILWSGRSPAVGNGNPLQYSCLRNPMDKGAWQAIVHGDLKRVRYDLVTKQTSHILDAISLTLLSVLTMWHKVLNSCGLTSSQTDVCPLQSALIPLCNPHPCDQTKAQCLHTPASYCETNSRDSQSQNGIHPHCVLLILNVWMLFFSSMNHSLSYWELFSLSSQTGFDFVLSFDHALKLYFVFWVIKKLLHLCYT